MSLNVMRYMTFEISKDCDFAVAHAKCPAGHPDRFKFGRKVRPLDDETVLEFWKWARFKHNFRGIIQFSGYSEPTLQITRVYHLMNRIKKFDVGQPFRLITNRKPTEEMLERFDLVRWTRYDRGAGLDDRIFAVTQEPKLYEEVAKVGWCGRKFGWEVWIDYWGNWPLCCGDWRCDESVGNIWEDDWDGMLERFEKKGRGLTWDSLESYNALPRLCRNCVSWNPGLYMSGGA